MRAPSHLEKVVRRWWPALFDGVRPSKVLLEKGETLAKLADSLVLPHKEGRAEKLPPEQEDEAIWLRVASGNVSAMLTTASEQPMARGVRPSMPLTVCTDSVSNLQVTVNAAAANRSTRRLRRWHALRQPVKEGKVDMYHLGDESMLADFFTKFVDKAKAEWSIKVITNANNAVSAAKMGAA